MNSLRYFSVMVVLGLTALAMSYAVVIPWKMNIATRRVYEATTKAISLGSATPAVTARENLEALSRYRRRPDFGAVLLVLSAANSKVLGRTDESIALYKLAAEKEGRPEIYRYLAEVELEAGRTDAAISHFSRAVEFAPSSLALVPAEVRGIVEAQANVLRQRR